MSLMLNLANGQIVEATQDRRPTLATPEQLAAELRVLKAVQDPRVLAAVGRAKQSLLDDPAAKTAEGRALLDRAVSLWLYSLAFQQSAADTARPFVVWALDDTPHSWFGHTVPGMGIAGDNPDNVYRWAFLDGNGRYEIDGHVDRNAPTQFSVMAVPGLPGVMQLPKLGKGNVDGGNLFGIIRGSDVHPDENGNFNIALDAGSPMGDGPHIRLAPGPVTVLFRDTRHDWRNQVPTRFSIRRVDGQPAGPVLTDDRLANNIANTLADWVTFFAAFKEKWLSMPEPNRLTEPAPRDGGWGLIAAGRFNLEDDEAMVITAVSGGTDYTGVQVLDRWFLTADTRTAFSSLNSSQIAINADGTVTYVVALKDPGVANWLDPSGQHQGFIQFRWQPPPVGVDPKTLLRSVRLMKLDELRATLPADARFVSPEERAAALHRRAEEFENRLRF
jgi:hypothetical protein